MRQPGEIVWLRDLLRQLHKKAPKHQWPIVPASCRWDAEDILRGYREESVADGITIWKALHEFEASGRWPKLSKRATYFLRERLLWGIAVCDSWLETNAPGSIALPNRPSDAESLACRVIMDHWEQKGSSQWIEEHKDEFRDPDED